MPPADPSFEVLVSIRLAADDDAAAVLVAEAIARSLPSAKVLAVEPWQAVKT